MASDEREIELLTIRNIMNTENGRAFMWRNLRATGIFGMIFDNDPLEMARREGRREYGVWLDRELKEAAPDEYLKMLKEHFDG